MQRNESVGEQASDGSRVWVPGIVACFARFLSANEVASILRLVDKATSQQYADCKTVRLSLPSPAHIFKECWGRPESFCRYTLTQRLKLLCLTAASGSIANLEVALDNAEICVQGRDGSELLEAASEAAQLDVCKMLRGHGCPWGDSLYAAARGGHRHMCEWMLASGCPLTPYAVNAAAHGGHEGLMYWLMTRQVVRPAVVESLLCAAAYGLSLVAFQRLHQQLLRGQQQGGGAQQQQLVVVLGPTQQARILAAAAGSSTPDWQAKVEWLEGRGYPRNHRVCASAAACSPDEEAVSRLQWLCSRGYTPDAAAVREAASHGNLAALCWLVEQAGVRPGQGASASAARNGHLAVLQYLHARGLHMEPQSDLGQLAAEKGHLPVVAWMVEALGVTPDNTGYLLIWAAGSGSMELMAWLRERGWTWDHDTISNAVRSGCEEAVEWLVEQGCPLPLVDSLAYTDAAENSDLAMIRCLHRLGCPWSPDQLAVYFKCQHSSAVPIPVLRSLLELGGPVDWDEALKEAEWLPAEVQMWLGEERQRQLLGAQQ